jgi:hypothetical protein
MTTTLKNTLTEQLNAARAELKASLAAEKLIEVPPASSWDAWPAGYMARRSWRVGYSSRCRERRDLRRNIRTLKALLRGGANVDFTSYKFNRRIVNETFALAQKD